MDKCDYKKFYETVGNLNGWDFSKIHVLSEEPKWKFYDEVKRRAKTTDILLDVGTGSGEKLLTIAPILEFTIGIDLSHAMIQAAKENLKKSNLSNVQFLRMSSEEIEFPASFFDVVSSRHAPFDAVEVARVLKTDGLFLTQQVSEADKLNIKTAFKRGQSFSEKDGALKEKYISELKKAGFSDVQSFDYNVNEYYQRPEDLIFLLQHTPIIPNFGMEPEDYSRLTAFIESNRTEKGICTNSKRFLIIAKK
ncbi:MAG: class I SAM-dependent methyltransferase [Carnobacterium alterfunditum]